MGRGRKLLFFYFIVTGLLLTVYNNCGQALKGLEATYTFSSKTGAFWPNNTTTLTESDSIVGAVIHSDLDNDGMSEVIFLSDSKELVSPVQEVIRIVDAESFEEKQNILGLSETPSQQMAMLIVDLDQDESSKEIIYINKRGTVLTALEPFSEDPTEPRWQVNLIERINFENDIEIYVDIDDGVMSLIVGNTRVNNLKENPNVSYFNDPIDGGWSDYSGWTTCSRLCGGGTRLRMRACSSPMPQNGGAVCTGGAVQKQSCNTQECDTNCPDGQHFEVDRCVNDFEDASGQTSSVGGGSGGVGGGGGGGSETTGGGSTGGNINCGPGMARNLNNGDCVSRERSCQVPNGGGTQIWQGRSYGACTNIYCFVRGTILVEGRKCMFPQTFRSNNEDTLSVRMSGSKTPKQLADQFCQQRGYELAHSFVNGGVTTIRTNPDNPNSPVEATIQHFRSVTCVR